MDSPVEPGAHSRQLWDILAMLAGLAFVLRSPSPSYGDRDGFIGKSPRMCFQTLASFVLTSLQLLTVIVHCFFEPSERSIIGDYVEY